jgi:ABC-type transporter Mla subunit MlaD
VGAVASRREQAARALAQAADARNLLVAIGRNINQIAKHANSTGGELPAELASALAAVERTCNEVTRRMREVAVGRSSSTEQRIAQ